MIKAEFNKEGTCSLECHGTVNELLADTGILIQEIYKSIHEQDPMLAEIFKMGIAIFSKPECPIWKVGDSE